MIAIVITPPATSTTGASVICVAWTVAVGALRAATDSETRTWVIAVEATRGCVTGGSLALVTVGLATAAFSSTWTGAGATLVVLGVAATLLVTGTTSLETTRTELTPWGVGPGT